MLASFHFRFTFRVLLKPTLFEIRIVVPSPALTKRLFSTIVFFFEIKSRKCFNRRTEPAYRDYNVDVF